MAFTNANLALRSGGAAGTLLYFYSTSEAMAALLVQDYFQNVTYDTGLKAGDQIYCQCADGNMILKVASVNTDVTSTVRGRVHVNYAGGDLPIQTAATGTEAALVKLRVGFYEVGTAIASATRYVLPTPYPGAVVQVRKTGSGAQGMEFDAGASASDVSFGSGTASFAGGGTGVTYDGTRRRITLVQESNGFRVRATSTSRWRIEALDYNASAVSEGASVVMLGT